MSAAVPLFEAIARLNLPPAEIDRLVSLYLRPTRARNTIPVLPQGVRVDFKDANGRPLKEFRVHYNGQTYTSWQQLESALGRLQYVEPNNAKEYGRLMSVRNRQTGKIVRYVREAQTQKRTKTKAKTKASGTPRIAQLLDKLSKTSLSERQMNQQVWQLFGVANISNWLTKSSASKSRDRERLNDMYATNFKRALAQIK